MRSTLLVPLFFAICSCSSPPKPPGVDETRRHPVNAAAALDLKRCKNDLQNSKISVAEATAETAALKTWAGQVARQAREYRDGPSQNSAEARNTIYSIPFDFGSVHIAVSSEDVEHLVAGARRAAWIVLSGRTDGASDTIAEGRVARARVEAVRDLLVRYGIEPARIRSTWQPVGDPAADGSTKEGRALNRRVEVELYPAAPRHAALAERSLSDPGWEGRNG